MTEMDKDNPIVEKCIEGLRWTARGKIEEARECYRQAWKMRKNAVDACVAAHYVAKGQTNVREALKWNLRSLAYAKRADPKAVGGFFPSLYINIADNYEKLGDRAEASKYFGRAARVANETNMGSYGRLLGESIRDGLRRTQTN